MENGTWWGVTGAILKFEKVESSRSVLENQLKNLG